MAALIVSSSYVIAHYYEAEIKALIINKLDNNLNTELNVDDVEWPYDPAIVSAAEAGLNEYNACLPIATLRAPTVFALIARKPIATL